MLHPSGMYNGCLAIICQAVEDGLKRLQDVSAAIRYSGKI